MTLYFSKWYVLIGLAVLFVIFIFLIERTKKNIWKLIAVLAVSAMFVFSVDFFFYNVLKQHQRNRINIILGIEKDIYGVGYNLHQSKIAIGSGGLVGKGFLNGTQTKLKYVPEQDTDFIFCTIGEEQGFLGSAFVLIMFIAFILRLVKLAERQDDVFGRVFGYTLASIFFFHFTINIGMVLGIMPVIGIPLPFFSYGGSSFLGFTILLFTFLRVDADRQAVKR